MNRGPVVWSCASGVREVRSLGVRGMDCNNSDLSTKDVDEYFKAELKVCPMLEVQYSYMRGKQDW